VLSSVVCWVLALAAVTAWAVDLLLASLSFAAVWVVTWAAVSAGAWAGAWAGA